MTERFNPPLTAKTAREMGIAIPDDVPDSAPVTMDLVGMSVSQSDKDPSMIVVTIPVKLEYILIDLIVTKEGEVIHRDG
mgnify:CR=1 FL=1|jgi:hypothetical protein